MKTNSSNISDRLLSLLGLDFDFHSDAFSERFSQVEPQLWLGGRPTAEDIPALEAAGVTHVLSALSSPSCAAVQGLLAGFSTQHLVLDDAIRQDMRPAFEACIAFAEQAVADKPQGAVLMHCEAGVSRSASLMIAWLMRRDGESFLQAFERVKARRARVLPNIGFASQLQRLELELQPERNGVSESLARYLCGWCNVPADFDEVQAALQRADYDALRALRLMYGDELPRVIQGAKA